MHAKFIMHYIFLIIALLWKTSAYAFHVDNVKKQTKVPTKPYLNAQQFFTPKRLPSLKQITVTTNPQHLLFAAQDALRYLEMHSERTQIINPEAFQKIFDIDSVKKTLNFIITTTKEDQASGSYRLHDSEFLRKHFTCLRWTADQANATNHNIQLPNNEKIRLTSYGVLEIDGNKKKTVDFPCALYTLRDNTVRIRFTKQQIVAGAFEKPELRSKVTALTWLTRQGLEDALMHGTVIVNFEDGSRRMFNVDKHNNIPYDRSQKNILAQKRYWFFRELKDKNNSFDAIFERMNRRRNVIFAGDLHSIGLGKVIALIHKNPTSNKKEMLIGVLADTGGAFIKNLYQLDLYGGIFSNKTSLTNHLKQFPPFTRAMILCKR